MPSSAGLVGVRSRDVVTEARGRAAVEDLPQPSAPAAPGDVPAAVARAWWAAYAGIPDDRVAGRPPGIVTAGTVPG
ncbi:MAG: hypothetical protein IT200_06580 [Thermoleophilia bacterium]|nr:hypothetical protein [Thermoleophilia bacterium]